MHAACRCPRTRAGRGSTACRTRNGRPNTRKKPPSLSRPRSKRPITNTKISSPVYSGDDRPLALTLALTVPKPARTESLEESSMATAAAAEPPAARFAKDHLKAFVERVERLEEEKKAIGDAIRDGYADAKANGFDGKQR